MFFLTLRLTDSGFDSVRRDHEQFAFAVDRLHAVPCIDVVATVSALPADKNSTTPAADAALELQTVVLSSSGNNKVPAAHRTATTTTKTIVVGPLATKNNSGHATNNAATASPRLTSSVVLVSPSYLEGLSSTLRSSTDHAFLESRRLRRLQDEEIQTSSQSDRASEENLHQLNMAYTRRRAGAINSQDRLYQQQQYVSSSGERNKMMEILNFNDSTRRSREFGHA